MRNILAGDWVTLNKKELKALKKKNTFKHRGVEIEADTKYFRVMYSEKCPCGYRQYVISEYLTEEDAVIEIAAALKQKKKELEELGHILLERDITRGKE